MPSIDPSRLRTGMRAKAAHERLAAAHQAGARLPARARLRYAAAMAGAWLNYTARRALDVPGRLFDRTRQSFATRPDNRGAGRRFLVVGHRGSPKRRVENTIESMEHAVVVEQANALEIDLSLTADGEIVLWHDWEPDGVVAFVRQLGIEPNQKYAPDIPALWSGYRRPTDELTLAELRKHYGYKRPFWFWFSKPVDAYIPTLREFYDWAVGQQRLRAVFLDLKMPARAIPLAKTFAEGIRAVLEATNPKFATICMSIDEEVIAAMRTHAPELEFTHDVEIPPGIVQDTTRYSAIRNAVDSHHRTASIGRPALTFGGWRIYQEILRADLERLAEHNRAAVESTETAPPIERLIGWTINAPSEAKRMIELGVHGILTDRPRALRRIATELGRILE